MHIKVYETYAHIKHFKQGGGGCVCVRVRVPGR